MDSRKLALILSVATLIPAVSPAASPSLTACVNAFAKSMATPGGQIPAYKLVSFDGRTPGWINQYFLTHYTYDLEAKAPKSGVVARARCVVDTHGTVLALAPLSIDSDSTRVASLD